MLRILGKLGKGFATVAGILIAGGGVVAGHGDVTDAFKQIAQHGPAIVSALGVILAAFGVGRKAGAAAAEK